MYSFHFYFSVMSFFYQIYIFMKSPLIIFFSISQEEAQKTKSDLDEKITLLTNENGDLKNRMENQQVQIENLKEEKQALFRELELLKKKVNGFVKVGDLR